jgi:hypothetical protein
MIIPPAKKPPKRKAAKIAKPVQSRLRAATRSHARKLKQKRLNCEDVSDLGKEILLQGDPSMWNGKDGEIVYGIAEDEHNRALMKSVASTKSINSLSNKLS